MSDLVGNPEDRFSHNEAHIVKLGFTGVYFFLFLLQNIDCGYSFFKLRLHYNELAQRTATVWRYLTFGDIRCYTLKKSDECDH